MKPLKKVISTVPPNGTGQAHPPVDILQFIPQVYAILSALNAKIAQRITMNMSSIPFPAPLKRSTNHFADVSSTAKQLQLLPR